MRTALTVMADIMVLVVALAVTEFHAMRRFSTFTVPFTDRLIACGAIRAENRGRILKEDRVLHIVGMLIPVVIWLMLCRFFAGMSGPILFPVGVAALLMLLRPGMGRTTRTGSNTTAPTGNTSTTSNTMNTWPSAWMRRKPDH